MFESADNGDILCAVCPHAKLFVTAGASSVTHLHLIDCCLPSGWLGSRVVSVLDSGAVGPGFKSQPQRCRVAVLGKLFTPIVLLFTKQ